MDKTWKENLTEYGNLHNEDCYVNQGDGGNCDMGMKLDDCCENIRMVSAFFKEEASKIIEFISHDMKLDNEEQRKGVVELYKEHFDIF